MRFLQLPSHGSQPIVVSRKSFRLQRLKPSIATFYRSSLQSNTGIRCHCLQLYALFNLVLFLDSGYRDEWTRLWEEHYEELYNYYNQTFHTGSKELQSLDLDQSTNNPVPNYDISEHLALLNLPSENFENEFVVTVPLDGESDCRTAYHLHTSIECKTEADVIKGHARRCSDSQSDKNANSQLRQSDAANLQEMIKVCTKLSNACVEDYCDSSSEVAVAQHGLTQNLPRGVTAGDFPSEYDDTNKLLEPAGDGNMPDYAAGHDADTPCCQDSDDKEQQRKTSHSSSSSNRPGTYLMSNLILTFIIMEIAVKSCEEVFT